MMMPWRQPRPPRVAGLWVMSQGSSTSVPIP